jgi:phosphocarrier protein HPr
MQSIRTRVRDARGLHLTPSARVVECARRFTSHITLCHLCKEADACSILQVLSLGAGFGADVEIKATGPDEVEAVAGIAEVFSDGSGI